MTAHHPALHRGYRYSQLLQHVEGSFALMAQVEMLQAATERVAALETANEILRSQVAFLGASAEDSKNFIVSSK